MRWLRILVAGALTLVVAYLGAVNGVLAWGGVQKMFESTDQVKVDFRRAWSFWPGHVHVDDLRVTMQDRNVQFVLEIPAADVTIRLRDLLHRTFHATRVRASGIVFRFRHRIQPESAALPYVTAYPPIPGFEDPPLRESGPPTAPLDEAHYNLWTVHIDDVDAGVSEIWAQMFRFQGGARVRGAFRLRPAKKLWVGPAELALQGGVVTAGPHDVLRDVQGTLTCKVDDFDTESVVGMEPFRFISARLALSSQVVDLQAVNFILAPGAPVTLADGSGLLDTDVALDHGVITPDSRVSYVTRHASMVRPTEASVEGDIRWIGRGREGQRVELATEVQHARLALGHDSVVEPLQIGNGVASISSDNADVTKSWPFAGARLDLHEAILGDLRWLNDLPLDGPRSWKAEGGSGRVGANVTLSPDQEVRGSVAIGVHAASIRAAKAHFQGTSNLTATFRSKGREGHATGRMTGRVSVIDGESRIVVSSIAGDLDVHSHDARAHIDLRDLRAAGAGVTIEAPRARIDARGNLTGNATDSGHLTVELGDWIGATADTRVVGSSLSGEVDLQPGRARGSLVAHELHASAFGNGTCPWADVASVVANAELATSSDGAQVGKLESTIDRATFRWGDFTASAASTRVSATRNDAQTSIRVDARTLRLKNAGGPPKGWKTEASSLELETTLVGGTDVRGPARVEMRAVTGQVGKTRIAGNLGADLEVRSADAGHRTADVSGTIRTRDVALWSRQSHVSGWWADFDLDRLHLDTRQDFDFNGKIHARFRDGLPALYVLASEDEIPRWVPTVLPLHGLTLDLDVERFCRWADVNVIGASGGPLSAAGRVQVEPGETRGAVLVRLAAFEPISIGLDFVEDYSDSTLLAGNRWLERHLAPLTSVATTKHDDRCEPQPPKCE